MSVHQTPALRTAAIAGALAVSAVICLCFPRDCVDLIPTPEMSAVAAIRTIHTAQSQYYSQFGRYASSLVELGPPANLIGSDLANGKRYGYVFGLTATQSGYFVSASPESYNNSGGRSFDSDQSIEVHERLARQRGSRSSGSSRSPLLRSSL